MSDLEAINNLITGAVVLDCGSRTLPWIKHPRDTDWLVFCNSQEDVHKIHVYKHEHFGQLEHDIHAKTFINYHGAWNTYSDRFCQPVQDGTWPQQDIYDPIVRQEILAYMKKFEYCFLREPPMQKVCYHVYTTLAMWRNGNYQLTDEDVEIINRFHDRECLPEDYKKLLQLYAEVQ